MSPARQLVGDSNHKNWFVLSTDDARTGMAEVDVDATGKISSITITEGTFGYIDNPIFDITNQGT